jgi:hypothetical protein
LNPHPHPRGKSLIALLAARKASEDGRNRDDFLDRGVASNSECYSDSEFLLLHTHLLQESSVAPAQVSSLIIIYNYANYTLIFIEATRPFG